MAHLVEIPVMTKLAADHSPLSIPALSNRLEEREGKFSSFDQLLIANGECSEQSRQLTEMKAVN
jgi:hypothetical protein